jgi:hypothetical protein
VASTALRSRVSALQHRRSSSTHTLGALVTRVSQDRESASPLNQVPGSNERQLYFTAFSLAEIAVLCQDAPPTSLPPSGDWRQQEMTTRKQGLKFRQSMMETGYFA